MKKPIEWHQKCLENVKAHVARKLHELNVAQSEYARAELNRNFYAEQIIRAMKLGLDGFDSERFMKKRK